MTTFAEYEKAEDTIKNYRLQATERVVEYINSGQSEIGRKIHLGSSTDPNAYYASFSMVIAPNAENKVLVWLNPWNSRKKKYRIDVPLEVLDGVL